MRHLQTSGLLLAAALASACSEGFTEAAGDSVIFCDTLFDDGPAVDLACVDCEVENAGHASDNDAHSFATVRMLTAAETQGAAVTAAVPFFFFSAEESGQQTGAFVRLPQNGGGTLASYAVRIRTFSGGVVRQTESAQFGADLNLLGESSLKVEEVPGDDASLPSHYLSFVPSYGFDQMEIHLSATGLHDGGHTESKIYGLCSNGGIRG